MDQFFPQNYAILEFLSTMSPPISSSPRAPRLSIFEILSQTLILALRALGACILHLCLIIAILVNCIFYGILLVFVFTPSYLSRLFYPEASEDKEVEIPDPEKVRRRPRRRRTSEVPYLDLNAPNISPQSNVGGRSSLKNELRLDIEELVGEPVEEPGAREAVRSRLKSERKGSGGGKSWLDRVDEHAVASDEDVPE